MPAELPKAPRDVRKLAERDDADGYDTQVALFFADYPEDDDPTEIEGGDFGERARQRSVDRAGASLPPLLRR